MNGNRSKASGPHEATYMFAVTSAHHVAEFSPGTQQIVALPGLKERTTFVLNIEHVAGRESKEWFGGYRMGGVPDGRHDANTQSAKFFGMQPFDKELFEKVRQVVDKYGISVERQSWSSVAGDASPLERAGFKAMQLIEIGYWYHSSNDTPDAVSPVGLERVARAYYSLLNNAGTALK